MTGVTPISSLPESTEPKPFWSVMVPAYNPMKDYLKKTLEGVLDQDPGENQMQIEVVDDCSPDVNTEAMVKSIAGKRIAFSRTPKNLGLAGCWNTCIERSGGQWVHILHQDDYILPGFYQTLAKAAERHPEVSLLATRSFFVDEEGVIQGVSPQLRLLENGGRTVNDFFYDTPIQCPGVVVKRSFYEVNGGFRSDLLFTLDCEMWARAIGSAGGLITPEVLSCYRMADGNESDRLTRTAEGLRDLERFNQLSAGRYPGFDCKKATLRVCNLALRQAGHFSTKGDIEAAKANMDYWTMKAPASLRLRWFAVKIARSVFR